MSTIDFYVLRHGDMQDGDPLEARMTPLGRRQVEAAGREYLADTELKDARHGDLTRTREAASLALHASGHAHLVAHLLRPHEALFVRPLLANPPASTLEQVRELSFHAKRAADLANNPLAALGGFLLMSVMHQMSLCLIRDHGHGDHAALISFHSIFAVLAGGSMYAESLPPRVNPGDIVHYTIKVETRGLTFTGARVLPCPL